MRNFIGINLHGSVFAESFEIMQVMFHDLPTSVYALTWIDALYEMFPDLSRSEIMRRVKGGAFSPGETMTLGDTKEEFGLKAKGAKGFDFQVIKLGNKRGIVFFSEELRGLLIKEAKNGQRG